MPKLIIIGIIILIGIGAGILFLSQQGTSEEPEQSSSRGSGRELSNLAFKDYKGNSVAFADFQGTPLVVNSWAVWCPFCVKELQEFVSLQKEFPQITIVAIDRAESLQTAKSYTDNIGISEELLFLLDPADSFYRSIGGFSMPESLFVDEDGFIQDHKRGPMDLDEMRQRVQKIL